MAKRCKGLNSKCFLFTYLMIVVFILILWANKLPSLQKEHREIPVAMQDYIESPSRDLSSFSQGKIDELVLTSDWLKNKWSFVYFTHGACLPACRQSLDSLAELNASFASNDVQFLVIGLDSDNESLEQLQAFLTAQTLARTVALSPSNNDLDSLSQSFIALFLKTDFADGSYLIEQEHHIFLVDPKGRIYATFRPPLSGARIRQQFLKLRLFYGRTE